MYKAPFQIYMYKDRRITVDFSNAVPLNLNHASRNLGHFYLGIYDNQRNCIELIGNSIPYFDPNWLSREVFLTMFLEMINTVFFMWDLA